MDGLSGMGACMTRGGGGWRNRMRGRRDLIPRPRTFPFSEKEVIAMYPMPKKKGSKKGGKKGC